MTQQNIADDVPVYHTYSIIFYFFSPHLQSRRMATATLNVMSSLSLVAEQNGFLHFSSIHFGARSWVMFSVNLFYNSWWQRTKPFIR